MTCKQSFYESNSNQHQISPHSINTLVHTHEKVVSIKEVITKEKLSCTLKEFSKLVIGCGKCLETGRRICILASGL